ncbi:MAG TPA: restriction endonuclease subunit S [Firmicutes bacterium]|uniref:restriction endonuclease subunit S n=1 Tax=uncultured Subdoligranulum sp. TaxID=512298 RepID=UPI001F9E8D18|nr:restriction endonuclease subunit S [uncultured Subdoligranulum sp.]HJB25673.1 restriction endonuclease subunit S [Bacillota bacterium]
MRKMKESGIEWIGKCPSNWNMIPTKYLFQVVSGATPQADQYENWDGDIIWITPADFKTDDRNVSKGKRTLTQKGFNSCSTTLIPAGSLIFSKRAPIGAVVVNSVDLCTNQGCLSSIPYNSNLTCVRYFYYVMAVATDQYELLGSGTTFKEISATNFSNFVLPTPAYEEQQQIATYLDARCAQVDALIANVQAQIEKLKAYKQRMITEVVTKGLNPSVPMKDSGVEWIGKIPAHWNITRKLSFVTTEGISYGIVKLYAPDDVDGVKVLRCSDVLEGFIKPDNVRTVTQEVSNEYARTLLTGGEVVVNVRGSLGGCAVVPDSMSGYNIAREVAKISLSSKMCNRYVMYYLLSSCFVEYRTSHLSGSVYVGLNIELLSSCPLPTPELAEQTEIANYLDGKCAQINQLISLKQTKIDKLNEYKKSLIYEYVTGKKEA